MRTYESDLMYPWSQGKAPWAVEQGGDGQVPDNAREKVGTHDVQEWKSEQRFSIWRKLEADKQSALKLIRCNLSDPSQIPEMKSPKEVRTAALWMYGLTGALEKFAVELAEKKRFSGDAKVDRKAVERRMVDNKLDAEMAKMSELMISMRMKEKIKGREDGGGDARGGRRIKEERGVKYQVRKRR